MGHFPPAPTGGATGATGSQGPTGATGSPGLTSASGSLSGDVTITHAATTTVLTTASLAPGTWLVTARVENALAAPSSAGIIEGEIVVGTATATITGAAAGTGDQAAAIGSGTDSIPIVLTVLAVVTVAGTLVVRCHNSDAINDGTAFHVTQGPSAFAGATGYTAVKIA